MSVYQKKIPLVCFKLESVEQFPLTQDCSAVARSSVVHENVHLLTFIFVLKSYTSCFCLCLYTGIYISLVLS